MSYQRENPTRRLGQAQLPPPPTCPICGVELAELGVARIMQSEGQWEVPAVALYCAEHFVLVTDRAEVEDQTENYHRNLKSFEAIALKRDSLGTGLSVMRRGARITARGLFNTLFPLR